MSIFSAAVAAMNANHVSVFGTPCTYRPAEAPEFAVNLILVKPAEGDADYPGAYLRASGLASDFATASVTPAKGDRVGVDSKDYIVFAVREAERGLLVLLLNER